jgi:hypothetical protein
MFRENVYHTQLSFQDADNLMAKEVVKEWKSPGLFHSTGSWRNMHLQLLLTAYYVFRPLIELEYLSMRNIPNFHLFNSIFSTFPLKHDFSINQTECENEAN